MGGHDLEPGAVFAGYTIERVLGAGGMGTVYLAWAPRLRLPTALKLLNPVLTADDYVRTRFEREAEHVARLGHPNIIAVYDRGRQGDQLWIAMQYIEGTDAAVALSSGSMPTARAVHVVSETAKGLDYAHHLGVLHRDVKPANILLGESISGQAERVLLTDFGIAKALDETKQLTRTGTLVASMLYAAPEQLEGTPLDRRADVYSLGCTLYCLLTGAPPYPGADIPAIMRGHLYAPIPRPSDQRDGLSQSFDAVIAQALAKDREDRYSTCGALAAAARNALQAPPSPAAAGFASEPGTETVRRLPGIETVRRPPGTETVRRLPGTEPPREPPLGPWPTRQQTSPEPFTSREQFDPMSAAALGSAPAPQPRIPWWNRTSTVAIAVILAVLVIGAVGVLAYQKSSLGSAPSGPTTTTGQTRTTQSQASQTQPQTQSSLPFSDLDHPLGVAVGAAGDVFVVDAGNQRVLKLAAGSSAQAVLPFTGLDRPAGVAVDPAGNLFVVDGGNQRVLKLAAGSSAQAVLPFTGLGGPGGVAVDAAGDVFVVDYDNQRVLMLRAGASSPTALPFTGLQQPGGIAVDAAGDVFIAEYTGNSRVLKLAAGAGAATVLPFTGLGGPEGIAVDAAGNVFIADGLNSRVLKLAVGSTTPTVLPFTGLRRAVGVAVDADGNVFVADYDNNEVLRLPAGAFG